MRWPGEMASEMWPGRLVALVTFVSTCGACGACGRGAAPSATLPDGAKVQDAAVVVASAVDPVLEELWGRANGGDADDLARLADREGESGLAARGERDPAARMTALRAMAYAPEPLAFAGLPFLAEAARGADEAQAEAALESTIDLAARPRRALDPEDAAEMKAGCDLLLALANDPDGESALRAARSTPKAVRARRVSAIRALRMLADRGCADPHALPTDLDAR